MERICNLHCGEIRSGSVGIGGCERGEGVQFGNKGLVLAARGLWTPGDYVKGHDVYP